MDPIPFELNLLAREDVLDPGNVGKPQLPELLKSLEGNKHHFGPTACCSPPPQAFCLLLQELEARRECKQLGCLELAELLRHDTVQDSLSRPTPGHPQERDRVK